VNGSQDHRHLRRHRQRQDHAAERPGQGDRPRRAAGRHRGRPGSAPGPSQQRGPGGRARRLGEARVDADTLLAAALRLRPDRILLGELRGREAFAFLRAVNSGHPGSLTTVHADSPAGALDQIALLSLTSGVDLGWDKVQTYVSRVIDVLVQLDRTAGRP
jgi:type IV secretory pathway ATPase VirB11/archaellum biosynthesis ATPase